MDTEKRAGEISVEVWSDIMCPFCYLGKRKFALALAEFESAPQVTVEWKSFQLAPHLKTDPSISIHDHLARAKSISVEEARAMNAHVERAGRAVGLEFRFDDIKVANTFNAHRLLHFAKKHSVQNDAAALLFEAYFTLGLNVDDRAVLCEIGEKAGIPAVEVADVMRSEAFSGEVKADIYEASALGVTGVPFFVFNRRYAVSGAREPAAFLQVLQKVAAEN
jgi:predicted DsbA family dithiol-disulfide isomerase